AAERDLRERERRLIVAGVGVPPAACGLSAALRACGGGLSAALRASGPRVVALPATLPAAAALRLVDLSRGVLQGRADLFDLHLQRGPLRAGLFVCPPAGHEPSVGDDTIAALERLSDVLGRLAPDRASHPDSLAVLPLVGLLVE